MTYLWYLVVTESAQKHIDSLNRADLFLIFAKLIELLYADDPTNLTQVTDIKRLKALEYRGLWRKRAGNWRILYRLEEETFLYHDIEYKGKLIIEQVVNRRDL